MGDDMNRARVSGIQGERTTRNFLGATVFATL
jgi:hypothetical protein